MARLLLINPNTSAHVTELLAGHARRLAPAGAQLRAATAPFGAAYIASPKAAAMAALAVPEVWRRTLAEGWQPDAVLVACFGDPGVAELRRLAPVPVLGLAEVAMREACQRGRFAIVTGGAAWGPMLRQLAQTLDLADALAGVHTVERTGAELLADPDAARELLLDACREALAASDDVRSIVLGGAALADLAAPLADQLPVPLIDNVQVGLSAAWHAACGSGPRLNEEPA